MILTREVYKRIIEKRKRLDVLRPLPPSLVDRLREQVIVEWTYNSNAIEGTSLSLRETELIIEHGLTIKGKSLKEHFEAVNHKDAILFLEELIKRGKLRFTGLLIRQIHGIILKEIDSENAGRYREFDVKITGSAYTPPKPSLISSKMRSFEVWLQDEKSQKNLIDFAALAHFKLVDIHPFIDGNGRTARLLMNLILMGKSYPATVIVKNDRARYYRALDLAHKGELRPFVDFIGRNVERSLSLYLDAVTPEKKKNEAERWFTLSKLSKETPYSQEYLSLLARRGRLEAVKKGRNWHSTPEAVKNYQKSLQRRK